MDAQHTLRIADVRRRFDRAANGFDEADFVHSVTRDGLFERMVPAVIDAHVVLDLGCATGSATPALAKRFRGATILAVDLSLPMLKRCRTKRGWFSKTHAVQADASSLPFADQSIDVIYSNLLLPWVNDPANAVLEVSRVLRKDGLFVFSSLGPDSLLEIRNAWAGVDDRSHVNRFLDMHDVGDLMVRAGLRDPVLDVDRLTVSYNDADDLFRDLTAAGARNSLQDRNRSLVGRKHFEAMRQRLENTVSDGKIELDLELVYGHCWGGRPPLPEGDVHIDASAIAVRKR